MGKVRDRAEDRRFRGRLFGAADRGWRLLASGFSALYIGFWLGLMETRDLEALTLAAYRRWNKYQDPTHNLQGLFGWEEEAWRDHFPQTGRVLVAGAGGGREAIALARKGYAVVAFECCSELEGQGAALARQEEVMVDFRSAPPSRVAAGLEPGFDAVVLGWTVYSHIPDRSQRQAFLRDVAGLLRPDGRLLISFLRRVEKARIFRLFHTVASTVSLLRWGSRKPELGDTLFESFDRYFTDREVLEEMEGAGFEALQRVANPQAYVVARRSPVPLT